ncbi:YidC/Oxa1 family membrane protein insertase [Christensenella timonensis]|uniref:YidC/Oxa1 family membrane protein insertase n=1 Tax=Christensenella timonensis TaxID=1816678 RepID=UPI00082AA54B|nr:YidC/Oxa1 family membrane protein insertase [Christensenella timonensis]
MDFLYNNFLSDFFSICMNGLNSLFADYALTIVILTILIRLCLLPLDLKMRSNSAKMQALGPEIQSLQKRYANNPQQLQRKQQELYRKMNVKPMLGCLPSLIQLPILFAFFGAMRVLQSQQTVALMLDAAQYGASTVQLPEFFWVHNFWQPDNGMSNILPNSTEFLSFIQQNSLYITPQTMGLLQSKGLLDFSTGVMSVPDATYTQLTTQILQANGFVDAAGKVTNYNGYFILPALAGVALFLQQKFNPAAMNGGMNMAASGGSEQAEAQGCTNKMMLWIFPIFSIWICATSNTAFALYWFISSLYAFTQMKLVDLIKKARAKKKEVSVV